MLDEGDDSFHVTRESYSHLSDSEWEVVCRIRAFMGEPAVSGMLESLDRDRQHSAIKKFLKGDLAVKRQKIALLHQQCYHQSTSGSTHTR